jgi:hypothetical protein
LHANHNGLAISGWGAVYSARWALNDDLRPTTTALSPIHHPQVAIGSDALNILSQPCCEIDAAQ